MGEEAGLGIRCLPTADDPARQHRRDGLLGGMRVDPTTGLYAFADFLAALPRLAELCSSSVAGMCGIGLAVGDVDGLKSLIEALPDPESGLSGHLRGHFFMTALGAAVIELVGRLSVKPVVMATFGGDEMLLIMPAPCPMSFERYLDTVRYALAERLPRTISFAWTWRPTCPPRSEAGHLDEYSELLMDLDRGLLARKGASSRRSHASFCERVPQLVVAGLQQQTG